VWKLGRSQKLLILSRHNDSKFQAGANYGHFYVGVYGYGKSVHTISYVLRIAASEDTFAIPVAIAPSADGILNPLDYNSSAAFAADGGPGRRKETTAKQRLAAKLHALKHDKYLYDNFQKKVQRIIETRMTRAEEQQRELALSQPHRKNGSHSGGGGEGTQSGEVGGTGPGSGMESGEESPLRDMPSRSVSQFPSPRRQSGCEAASPRSRIVINYLHENKKHTEISVHSPKEQKKMLYSTTAQKKRDSLLTASTLLPPGGDAGASVDSAATSNDETGALTIGRSQGSVPEEVLSDVEGSQARSASPGGSHATTAQEAASAQAGAAESAAAGGEPAPARKLSPPLFSAHYQHCWSEFRGCLTSFSRQLRQRHERELCACALDSSEPPLARPPNGGRTS
jgi:hypothetical protein